MKNFFIITNKLKDKDERLSTEIRSYLENKGAVCYFATADAEQKSKERAYHYTDPSRMPESVECILTIGGDGTLIQAARDTLSRHIPLFGINLGTLGYLAEVDSQNIYQALDALLEDRYKLEKRMLLNGKVYHEEHLVWEDVALNDIVISRESGLSVLNLNNYVNDQYLNTYRADGIILATPTGSTAYSLSAGGPIISPEASMIMMTPLAPHTLNARSVVFPSDNVITVEITSRRGENSNKAMAYFDGVAGMTMQYGDRIVITKADTDVTIVKIHNSSFLEILRRKMHMV